MKRKIVDVDATSPGKDRGIGDAPDLGRVAKVADSPTPKEHIYEHYTEDDDPPESGEWLIRLGMISALLIGLIVGGGLIYYTAVSKLGEGRMAAAPSDQNPRETSETAEPQPGVDGLAGEEALDLVRRALAVRFSSNVTDHFRYTKTLDPPGVVAFLKGLAESDGLVARMEPLTPVTKEGVVMARVRVYFMADGSESSRDAYLLKNADGDWKIDFDSFAMGGEPKDVKAAPVLPDEL